ncbi:hypothetical protein M8J77_017739 [Diaphorina citri]|nr:hypothetical protein M8J77_017739 [Diaphorina citri]
MANVNMDLVYSMIEYKCVHGGEYKSNGNGQRKTKTLKQGCPFVMKINLSPDAQKLRISRLEECHNHEISKETFRSLPKQRLSLDERQRGSIQEMLALKCNKKLVKQHIVNVMDKDVTLRDIHNMKPKNSNSLEETVNYLKSLGGYVEVLAIEALDSIHGEQKSRAINMVLKQSTEHEKGSIEEYYESCLTPYAWNLVCGEIEAAKNMAFCFEATASPETCGCSFFINTSLPCRHIFFKRSDAGLPLAAGILIPLRFSKEKHMSLYSCNLDRNEEPPTCTITSLPMPKKTKIMNKQEKYKKAMELFGDIANILSDYGTEKFSSTLKKLETFKDMLIKNPDNNNILDQETGVEEEGVAEVELVGESEEVLDVELVSEEGTMEMVGGEEGVLEVEMVGEEEVLDKEMVGEEEQVVEVVMVGEEVVKVDMIGEDKELVDVVMGGNILQEGQEGVSTIDLKNISIKGMALKRRGRPRGADSTVVGLKRRKLD